jgi:hypothetical protein
MPALDAFHSKQLAYSQFRTMPWILYAEAFATSVRGELPDVIGAYGYTETGPELTERLATTLDMAEIFYCSPLMNRLVSAAAEDWVDDEIVHVEDFPTTHGWVLVPGGLTMIDIRGRPMRTDALSWRVRGHLVEITYWGNKMYDQPWQKAMDSHEVMPQWTPWHLTQIRLGSPLPTTLQLGKMLPPEMTAQIHYQRTEQGLTASFPQGWSPEEMTPGEKTDGVLAWLVSMLRIMQQPLAAIHTEGLPANVRRQLKKENRRVRQTLVTVIDFRRREGDFDSHSEREYTHRFLRRGHWRKQPYKLDDGTWDRRRIWIHATIVGDPSLPLILREHVNALRR